MNIQQLRYLRETVRRDLNLTAAAAALHTDPAVDLADLLARLLRAGALIPSPTRNP